MRDEKGRFIDNEEGEKTQFRKGSKPWNKELHVNTGGEAGWFKKGNLPYNTKADGMITKRRDKRGVIYKFIRIGLAKWIPLQKYNWEKENGEIPPGMVLRSIDGNQLNCDAGNWKFITKAENLLENMNHEKARETFKKTISEKNKLKIKKMEEQPVYNFVNPEHYKGHGIETIDKMIKIWGWETVALYCEINAFKYRDRIGRKPGEPIEREMEKIKWYENKAEELRIENGKLKIEDQVETLKKLGASEVFSVKIPIIKTGITTEKVCKRCNQSYKPTSNRQVYCEECRPKKVREYEKNYRKIRKGEDVIRDGEKMEVKERTKVKYRKDGAKYGMVTIEKKCRKCGKDFETKANSQVNCDECRKKPYYIKKDKDISQKIIKLKEIREKRCLRCGESFKIFERKNNGQKHCEKCQALKKS